MRLRGLRGSSRDVECEYICNEVLICTVELEIIVSKRNERVRDRERDEMYSLINQYRTAPSDRFIEKFIAAKIKSTTAGFEPAREIPHDFESCALDHSAKSSMLSSLVVYLKK